MTDELAQELNAEFKQRYATDWQFRAEFNRFLRTLGVIVMPDEPRTLAQIGAGDATRH